MKLTKVRVQNYRSVEGSEEFEVGDLICLVGKNEAGKTALLSAMRDCPQVPSTQPRPDGDSVGLLKWGFFKEFTIDKKCYQ